MDLLIEESPMTTKKTRKTRSDAKLNADRLATIERCLKLRMAQRDICAVTGTNLSTISTVKLVLAYVGKL
jgi:hypothetical protein